MAAPRIAASGRAFGHRESGAHHGREQAGRQARPAPADGQRPGFVGGAGGGDRPRGPDGPGRARGRSARRRRRLVTRAAVGLPGPERASVERRLLRLRHTERGSDTAPPTSRSPRRPTACTGPWPRATPCPRSRPGRSRATPGRRAWCSRTRATSSSCTTRPPKPRPDCSASGWPPPRPATRPARTGYLGAPVVCQDGSDTAPTVDDGNFGGSIDPMVFTDDTGHSWLHVEERRQPPRRRHGDLVRSALFGPAHSHRTHTHAAALQRRSVAGRRGGGTRHGGDLLALLRPLLRRQRCADVRLRHRVGQLPVRARPGPAPTSPRGAPAGHRSRDVGARLTRRVHLGRSGKSSWPSRPGRGRPRDSCRAASGPCTWRRSPSTARAHLRWRPRWPRARRGSTPVRPVPGRPGTGRSGPTVGSSASDRPASTARQARCT